MKNKNSDVVRLMKEEYHKHLKGLLNELKPYTSTGIVVVSPDLKVIEKRSGFEYTVKDVEGEPGDMKITLRVPEEPRDSAINPSAIHPDFAGSQQQSGEQFVGAEATLESEGEVDNDGHDYGADAYTDSSELDDPHNPELTNGETYFVVDEDEFSKNYKEA